MLTISKTKMHLGEDLPPGRMRVQMSLTSCVFAVQCAYSKCEYDPIFSYPRLVTRIQPNLHPSIVNYQKIPTTIHFTILLYIILMK